MNAIVALIPVSIALLIVAGIAFFWAVDHGQFDDMDTPGLLPLEDGSAEERPLPRSEESVDRGRFDVSS